VRGACLLAAAAVATASALVSFQDLSALMRNHRELRHLITPGNYLVSLAVVLTDHDRKPASRTPVGRDAHVAARPAGARPRVLVLVIGETQRAQNWGLNGYARQTTPQLARIDPVNFRDVTACGTSTEVSLPCMFSPYGRARYDKARIEGSESLLHVLDHAGIAVRWRDNQSGCKGVCAGLPFVAFQQGKGARDCDGESCLDEVMLDGLAAEIAQQPGDIVVVLHQLGNHGPGYHRRYPPRLRRYTPTCDSDDLGDCSRAQIVNSYDDAVLYTDEFLARTIRLLAAQTDHDAALIYVSDHGESLGERGLYLHGLPYAIAPRTQTRVPMVVWLSPALSAARGIDAACLRARAMRPASHDNLFHSVLGLMQVRTSAYVRDLDLFTGCTAQNP
jgi:lipid A ethanolaminephosphotransferase